MADGTELEAPTETSIHRPRGESDRRVLELLDPAEALGGEGE